MEVVKYYTLGFPRFGEPDVKHLPAAGQRSARGGAELPGREPARNVTFWEDEARGSLFSQGLRSHDLRSPFLAPRASGKLGLRKHEIRVIFRARKSLTT